MNSQVILKLGQTTKIIGDLANSLKALEKNEKLSNDQKVEIMQALIEESQKAIFAANNQEQT